MIVSFVEIPLNYLSILARKHLMVSVLLQFTFELGEDLEIIQLNMPAII